MITSSVRRRPWLAALLAPLLVLAACGGDGDDDGSAPGATGDDDTRIVGEGEPQEGGTLISLVASDIQSLDPHTQSSFNTHNMVGPVYSRLVAFQVGPEVEYGEQIVEPDLAESWEVSDDSLTYTFRLRDDVVWQDIPPVNGRPFVAQDVVASMNRIREVGFASYMLENVEDIVAVDEHTVEFRLSAPFAPLLGFLAGHFMWVLPEEATNGGFDPTATAIGTGPFILTDRRVNVENVYVRNPDYYGQMPHIDGFRRLIVPDQGARSAAFRAGEADIVAGLSPEETEQVARTTPGARVVNNLSGTHLVVMVNQEREPMADIDFRRAISLAIDREGLGETIYGDGGQYSGPVVASLGRWALPQDELAEAYPYDPEAARELLAGAGLEGVTIGMVVTPGYGEQVVRGAQWIVQDLAEVGINAQVELVDYATYFGNRWPEQLYDIIVGLQAPFTEPDEWLRGQHGTGTGRNWFGISDPELDVMLDEQLALMDEDERVDKAHEIQRYIIENVMNPIPVWNNASDTLLSDRVQDYFPSPRYGYHWYRLLWLDRG